MSDPTDIPTTALPLHKVILAARLGDEVIELLLKHDDPEVAGFALQSVFGSAPPDVLAAMKRYEQAIKDARNSRNPPLDEGNGLEGLHDGLIGLVTGLLQNLHPGRPHIKVIQLTDKEALVHELSHNAPNGIQEAEVQQPLDEETMRASTRALLDDIESLDADKI